MIVLTTYAKQLYSCTSGCWLGETPVEIAAEVDAAGGSVFVVWTPETDAAIDGFDPEEKLGCVEAIAEAFFAHEREACRAEYVQQRLGVPFEVSAAE